MIDTIVMIDWVAIQTPSGQYEVSILKKSLSKLQTLHNKLLSLKKHQIPKTERFAYKVSFMNDI